MGRIHGAISSKEQSILCEVVPQCAFTVSCFGQFQRKHTVIAIQKKRRPPKFGVQPQKCQDVESKGKERERRNWKQQAWRGDTEHWSERTGCSFF